MPADLLDVNVWVAAAFAAHPAHQSAQAVLLQDTPAAPALFCRATKQSFLRLVSTPAICTTYQAASITNQDGLAALEALDQDFSQFLGAGLDLELLQADSHGGG